MITKVAVIGAGTMGQGIAHLAAANGFSVLWYDIGSGILEKGILQVNQNLLKGIELGKLSEKQKNETLNNIHTTTAIGDLKADIIIEAVVENLEVKIDVLQAVEKINGVSSIYASNTSSIPITAIASKLKHPERVIGLHFFNPAHLMKLVEVIPGAETSPQVIDEVRELAHLLGKTSVLVKDSPGFIVNRVARQFYLESLQLLEEQVADVQKIDLLMESTGFKMGPFRLMDLIGIDINLEVSKSMYTSFHQEPRFRPSRIQEMKVMAGHLGKKSKKGFYEY